MTAHDFLLDFEKKYPRLQCEVSTEETKNFFYSTAQGAQVTIDVMIEFAKMHVKKALEAALEDSPHGSSTDIPTYEDMKFAILDAYPESLIK